MYRRVLIVSAVTSAVLMSIGYAGATEQERAQEGVESQTQEQEQIYGSQLMTEQERAEFRAKMRAAKTAEEREQVRKEHHERMEVRAKERGLTLSDEPPLRGGGMGPGPGPGGRRP